jgi:IS605 OrfB family transposase
MVRSVWIRSPLNKSKMAELHKFMEIYQDCVNYFIARLWAEQRFTGYYLESEYIQAASQRFNLTVRLTQCAGKQAFEIVKSQRVKTKTQRQMPRFKKLDVILDSRFWKITKQSNAFEWIKVRSIGFTAYIPFNKTKVWNKWVDMEFELSKSIRLSLRKDKLFIEVFFKKELSKSKTIGDIEGLDLGYVNLAVCSDNQIAGKHINQFIRKFHKREKHTHKQIEYMVFNELKKLDLSHVKTLVLEDLKYVKHGKRGMFSREHNRRLSHWLYAKVAKWLDMRCEEQGIQLIKVSPYKTSQFCRFCGKWDRRNRSGEKFKCIHCGHEDHADSNGAHNLKLLGLAGVYSLRSLKTSLVNICL